MTSSRKLIIVDPIFRGSRVYFSWLAAGMNQLAEGGSIEVVTRTAAATEESERYFSDIPHEIHQVARVPESFWYGKIEVDQIRKIISKIREIISKDANAWIYFCGVNELYPQLYRLLLRPENRFLRRIPMVLVEYDAKYLFNQYTLFRTGRFMGGVRNFVKIMRLRKPTYLRFALRKRMLAARFLGRFTNASIAILDERIMDDRFVKGSRAVSGYFFLPDPVPERSGAEGVETNPSVSFRDIRILVVGLQTSRKGLIDIVEVCERGSATGVKFIIVGRLAEETEVLRDRISALSDHIEFHEGFFQEEDFQKHYREADYVILPYDTSFEGSSGVMSYAALYAKPLVTSEHGCIGYRVGRFDLGFTYRSRNVDQLQATLAQIPEPDAPEYRRLQENMKEFYATHTIEMHREVLASRFVKLGG